MIARAKYPAAGELTGQLLRFLLVGVAATCAHYLVALVSAKVIDLYPANLAGYLTAVAISYHGHQRFSFRLAPEAVSHRTQLPRFALVSLSGLALSYLILVLMGKVIGAPDWLSLAAAAGLVPFYTFLANKYCVFRAGGRLPGGPAPKARP
ncbi:MAG: GtrA family protein [Halieaceae bacterium]|nr:GtrA family protein [Halieaceae bacterium]